MGTSVTCFFAYKLGPNLCVSVLLQGKATPWKIDCFVNQNKICLPKVGDDFPRKFKEFYLITMRIYMESHQAQKKVLRKFKLFVKLETFYSIFYVRQFYLWSDAWTSFSVCYKYFNFSFKHIKKIKLMECQQAQKENSLKI